MTHDEKVNLVIKDIEKETFDVFSDTNYIQDRRTLLSAFNRRPIDFTHEGFYACCPSEDLLPNFKCDNRCDKDYTLQLECWKDALKDD